MTALGPKLMGSKASRHELDGAMRVIPGYEGVSTDLGEQYTGDEMPYLVITTSVVTTSTLESNLAETVIPFKAKLVSVRVCVTVSGVVTDGITLNIGTASDHGRYVSGAPIAVALNHTGFQIDMAHSSVKDRIIVAGSVLQVEIAGTTDAAGVAVAAIIAPQI